VPDQRQSTDINEDWSRMGFRIPAVTVSPFSRSGGVKHATLGHESILKLISYRWGLGHLNRRHRYAFNIGHTLNFDKPVFERPELPDPVNVASVGCPAKAESGFGAAARPNPHDMVTLVDSGYLDRVGFEWRVAGPEQMFRKPDSVRRALTLK
jgi:phospholipase C